jgi:hypothetical protein
MSDENHDLGPWEFIGRRGGETTTLVGGSVIAAVPEAERVAQEARRELRFDFLDDRAVLELLRRRHVDEEDMFKAGFVHGVPLALVGPGGRSLLGRCGAVGDRRAPQRLSGGRHHRRGDSVLLLRAQRDVALGRPGPVRQNLRARAAAYRKIAHIARRGGADIPAHYPHYGPYPFAATFCPDGQ